jgi:hypothetical protein
MIHAVVGPVGQGFLKANIYHCGLQSSKRRVYRTALTVAGGGNLRNLERLRQYPVPAAQHNQAVAALRLAGEAQRVLPTPPGRQPD